MKMKNLLVILGLGGLLVVSACEKMIGIEPQYAREGSRIFTSLQDYEFALTGAYALLRATGYYGSGGETAGTWSELPDMMGDNLVQTGEDLANWEKQVNWVYAADEPDIATAWISAYAVIAQANLCLQGIDKFAQGQDVKAVNRIKGQALALRARVHFDLLRFWGEAYDRQSAKLGIPYKAEVDTEARPSRLTVKQSYDRIFADLQQAETLLQQVDKAPNAGPIRAYLDLLAVQALLARIHLYAGEYAAAESYASRVIPALPLASKAAFPAIWQDASQEEVIWTIPFNAGEGSPAAGIHLSSVNRNRFRPAAALENAYDQAHDIRFAAYFGDRQLEGVNRRIFTKFYSRGAAPDNLVNWKAIRTGEMYLIRAEARARQGEVKAQQGLADLNALRAARIHQYAPAALAGQALLAAIALERQKELVAEGHRWFDLKRTTRTINRREADMATSSSLAAGAREWTWPIPSGEMDANPAISTQQTAGYQ